MTKNRLHYNHAQLKAWLIAAAIYYGIMGRGTGKTEGIMAPRLEMFFRQLPRGCQVIVGATYTQLLTRTLPGLIYGLEKLGYKNGVHFLIGEKPTEKWIRKWNWQGPFRKPLKYEYFISWYNGSGAHLVSQDRTGTSNGITIDGIHGDEAKFLNREKLVRELFPANRGIIHDFKGNPYHHGMSFLSDMPVGTSGRWLLDMDKEMDKERVNEILTLQIVRYKLLQYGKTTKNRQFHSEAEKQLQIIDDEIRLLRLGVDGKSRLLHYQEASSLENIDALGFDYIKEQLRDSTLFEFDTQIMNKRPLRLEDGFYPDLVEEVHGYFAYDYSHLDSIGYDFERLLMPDCRRDADLNRDEPLHISLDYNRRIHPIVVGQVNGNEIRTLKGLDVLYPAKLRDVLKKFCDYYRYHRAKQVYYWYDQTAVGEQRSERICDEVTNYLEAAGWTVVRCYIGKASTHESRYRMWGHLLKQTGKYDKIFRYNRDNCEYLALSMYQTQAEQRKDGFGKNKKPELDPKFPANEAPHYSEACDMWVYGILESGVQYSYSTEGIGNIIM